VHAPFVDLVDEGGGQPRAVSLVMPIVDPCKAHLDPCLARTRRTELPLQLAVDPALAGVDAHDLARQGRLARQRRPAAAVRVSGRWHSVVLLQSRHRQRDPAAPTDPSQPGRAPLGTRAAVFNEAVGVALADQLELRAHRRLVDGQPANVHVAMPPGMHIGMQRQLRA